MFCQLLFLCSVVFLYRVSQEFLNELSIKALLLGFLKRVFAGFCSLLWSEVAVAAVPIEVLLATAPSI